MHKRITSNIDSQHLTKVAHIETIWVYQ